MYKQNDIEQIAAKLRTHPLKDVFKEAREFYPISVYDAEVIFHLSENCPFLFPGKESYCEILAVDRCFSLKPESKKTLKRDGRCPLILYKDYMKLEKDDVKDALDL